MELILEQKQVQKLSPQMIQSMEILQMSTLELQEYLEDLFMENPVLEQENSYPQEEGSELLHRLEWLASGSRQNHSTRSSTSPETTDAMAAPTKESLYDHLCAQIPWRYLSPAVSRAVEGVLTGLNDNGWLEETTEELARRCGVSPETMAGAELIVQNMEPAGVGARTLAQCLELQLARRGESGLALTIVCDHLEDVAKSHFHQIARATGASREEIQQACHLIRSLDPRPGAAFAHSSLPAYITPDLLVTEENGRLSVRFVDESIPPLKISSYYQDLMHSSDDAQVRTYLSQKLQQANWVVKSIAQRKSTLLRCVECVVSLQEEFFFRGKHFLRPIVLSDVAAKIGVHESTVSRAVRNKYLQCTWGLFPVSDFFSRAVDEDTSVRQVKTLLRSMIDGEDKRKPLSDQKLCDALAEQGLHISRRTVAKYRDELGLPSAPGRKEF